MNTTPAHSGTDPTLTFWGAAGGVTGSMHLLEAGNHKVLLDCGLHQGRREEARQRNGHFPFHPHQIDAVVISHAHIDHCGNLPTLIRQGFEGPIYCTPPTRDLLRVMLADSAKIQEEDAAHINIARNYAEPWVQPLYTVTDVEKVFSRLVSVPYGRDTDVTRTVRFRFIEAGHVLGSAMIHLVVAGADRDHTVTFSGDMGRRGLPILKPTGTIPPADVLVCESTYGNRTHRSFAETVEKLYAAIRDTVDRGGKVLIPAFSLGRTQLIIHVLQQGLRERKIPEIPVYVDSPLASEVAAVYRAHPNSLSAEIAQALREGHGLLGGDGVTYVRDFEQSTLLASRPGSSVIIASSGMCDAGRIQQHLKQLVDDPRCSIILVSYQAQGTVGRKLLDNKPTVRFQGRDWNKWIDVLHLDGFSGHADKNDFIAYLGGLAGRVGKVRLIHGEHEQADALAHTLRDLGFADVAVPGPGDRVSVG
ncbi:MBL fold metallo-hydrolase [Frigoriglobus tundricola]|uniref:Metallo-beta-lactamase family protein, RNA-specific n=1 Tax=Frigoriglobus tundricola TaxID=2774151 RepID=A0A6M5Z1H5_9BACT|nr:MBL fold metallo-hydrolase [Frigoriglobus tundricola]QJW99596.1 Metallo-beta-lactamase family protein, RNA-specific [Frigoriglobus tundricola]